MFRLRTFKRLALFAILLTVSIYVFTGCERIKVDSVFQGEDLGFIDIPWEIVSVNDKPLEPPFVQDPDPEAPPNTFAITANSLVFHASGDLTGEIGFTLSEEYPGDPPTSATWAITNTITGKYSAGEKTLTIDEKKPEVDVVVTLTPREAWEQQIEGITLEQLQDDLAAESEMGVTEDDSPFAFITVGVNYTHQTEQDTLTLSVPGQKILLKKKTE